MASNPAVYTDIQGLAALRGKAHRDPGRNLREVASQFEAIFIQNMLKGARAASLGPGALDGPHSDTYREMYEQQLALTLAKGKGIGIAEMLVRQLQGSLPNNGQSAPPVSRTMNQTLTRDGGGFSLSRAIQQATKNPPTQEVTAAPKTSRETGKEKLTPGEFVAEVWPAASEAARKLGIDPKVLVAQAALESGWGGSVARQPNGQSSHNLFGIKADARWNGARVMVSTLEYQEGVAVRRRDPFRSYDSFAESFSDYVHFLSSNPRYQNALKQVNNPEAFLRGLQTAGYATDPAYARKVTAILRGDTLRDSLTNFAGV
ncbi:flagellar protein FlgJ [Gammaproteobacteria bacterium]